MSRTCSAPTGPDLAAALRRAARDRKVHPSTLFLAAYRILLGRRAGQHDIVIGIPTMGRQQRRFEYSIGYFVNVIPLRSRVPAGTSLGALVQQLRAALARGLDHAAIPFPVLVRSLALPRDPGRAPLFQAGFTYHNPPPPSDQPSAAQQREWVLLSDVKQEGDAELDLEVVDAPDEFTLHLTYSAELFEAATIAAVMDELLGLLQACPSGFDMPVEALGRAAPATVPATVVDAISARAAEAPDAIAVLAAEGEAPPMTYRALVAASEALAAGLAQAGVRRGDRVGLLARRSTAMVVGVLAVLRAGGTLVPLDPGLPADRLGFFVSDCGIRTVLAAPGLDDRLPAATRRGLAFVTLETAPARLASATPISPPEPGDAAYVIYTSGTTGQPKGVQVGHAALTGHCLAIADVYGLGRADRVLQFASIAVDTGLEQILPGLLRGSAIVVRGERLWTAHEFDRIARDAEVTVADLPPGYLRELLGGWAQERVPTTLRLMIVGGEALPPDTVRRWLESPLGGIRLLNAYGPTEATITSLVFDVAGEDWRPGGSASVPIGRPLPGTVALVLDEQGEQVPEGTGGELHLGGARLADGYVNRPELTAERFVEHPTARRLYATGDLARVLPGGLIEFLGRRDQQIRLRGHRVELGEVEAALMALPGVRQAAVVAREDAAGDAQLAAFVVAAGPDVTGPGVRAGLAATLPEHMIPASITLVPALPKTPGGKLDRHALAASEPVVVDDPRAGRLAAIWAEVLNVGSVQPSDDFFALGGHSILAIRLLSRVQKAFGVELAVADLLQRPRLEDQLALMERPRAAPLTLELRPGAGRVAPLFLLHALGGGVGLYRAIAERMPTGVPVIGVQSPGLCGGAAPTTLAEQAAACVAAIRTHQPSGPYHVAGWSAGGVLAYEVAQRLAASGEPVALLGLIDSYTPSSLARIQTEAAAEEAYATEVGRDPHALAVFRANAAALRDHIPRPYDAGPVVLVRAEAEAAFDRGWEALVPAGRLRTETVPGASHDTILQEPAAQAVAAILAAQLAAPPVPPGEG